MDFSRGLPPESRTLVVIPTMLTSAEDIDDLVEALEVRFLANRDDHLHFGLLTDFRDAPTETLPEDESLLALARKGIDDLNAKYLRAADPAGQGAHRRHFLSLSPSAPLESGGTGMDGLRAQARKARGPECAAARRRGRDRFSLVVGDTAVLPNVKYVITLDTDTQLPRDSARQFVGVMAHPLNRARFDTAGKRKGGALVTEGYGILQPRVSISLPGANRSWYARLHGGDPGIDPYTRAVSDVYQDVFGEGSFIGKGIYDVDAFERALDGRFPENRILSHDLLEGCYARSGLLSDVQLYEEHPSTYGADISRRHRWIRGDWQLLGWLLPLVPGPGKRRLRNPLSALSLWKLFDNLRRSLVPAGLTLLLLLGWTVLPHAWLWTLAVIAILLLPAASAFVAGPVAQAGRGAAAAAPRRYRERGRPARRADGADARLPAVRGVGQPRCDRTHRVANAGYASPAARMESVGHRTNPIAAAATSHPDAPSWPRRSSRCGSPRSSPRRRRS